MPSLYHAQRPGASIRISPSARRSVTMLVLFLALVMAPLPRVSAKMKGAATSSVAGGSADRPTRDAANEALVRIMASSFGQGGGSGRRRRVVVGAQPAYGGGGRVGRQLMMMGMESLPDFSITGKDGMMMMGSSLDELGDAELCEALAEQVADATTKFGELIEQEFSDDVDAFLDDDSVGSGILSYLAGCFPTDQGDRIQILADLAGRLTFAVGQLLDEVNDDDLEDDFFDAADAVSDVQVTQQFANDQAFVCGDTW